MLKKKLRAEAKVNIRARDSKALGWASSTRSNAASELKEAYCKHSVVAASSVCVCIYERVAREGPRESPCRAPFAVYQTAPRHCRPLSRRVAVAQAWASLRPQFALSSFSFSCGFECYLEYMTDIS